MSQENLTSPTTPPVFQDPAGRSWQVKLTTGLIDEILAETGLDLLPDDENYEPLLRLSTNHRKLEAVLWGCLQAKASRTIVPAFGAPDSDGYVAEHSLSRKELFADFDGGSYAKGWEALLDAVRFFIQSMSEARAKAFDTIVATIGKVMEKEVETQIELLLSQSTDEAMTGAISRVKEMVQREVTRELGSFATNSAE